MSAAKDLETAVRLYMRHLGHRFPAIGVWFSIRTPSGPPVCFACEDWPSVAPLGPISCYYDDVEEEMYFHALRHFAVEGVRFADVVALQTLCDLVGPKEATRQWFGITWEQFWSRGSI